jgi:hypothetical protein
MSWPPSSRARSRDATPRPAGASREVSAMSVLGILLLPWVLGLAVWEASWAIWVRLLLVLGLGWATVNASLPRKGR